MQRVVYVGGSVYSPVDPFATALVTEGSQIVWVGQDGAAWANISEGDHVVDLKGALVTPGFVDAHVHHSAAGFALTGLNLEGVRSQQELLDRLSAAVARHNGGVLLGHGWDETRWVKQELPTREHIDQIAGNVAVYLARTDVHSALVSSALAPEFSTENALSGEQHHIVRERAMSLISDDQRRTAIRAFRSHAASLGVVQMHECSGPTIAGATDAQIVREIAHSELGPGVVLLWGSTHETRPEGVEVDGFAGDFFIDGSVGSRTALLSQDYADSPTRGRQYLPYEQVLAHLMRCTLNGEQAGFHVIGDAALAVIVAALRAVAEDLGADAVRRCTHRLEHVELMTDDDIEALADLNIVASVQPSFDERWGGPEGMYAQRLGSRWLAMNRFAAMSSAGVVLAFGSDAPVIPVSPWEAIRAAAFHHNPEHRISVRAAFAAHTRNGYRAARRDGGVLAPGMPADLSMWLPTDLVVQAPDDRISAWSTDPRSGTPGLPDLTPGQPVPTCVRTVVAGSVIFDNGWLE